jgi:hypothetical protein
VLYIRYILEDYERQSIETRCDIIQALNIGLQEKTLSYEHIRILESYLIDRNVAFTGIRCHVSQVYVQDVLLSIFRYLEEILHYKDADILLRYKGTIHAEWLLKANQIAEDF